MSHSRRSSIVGVILVGLLLGPMVFGTSPAPNPQHHYMVSGHIVRSAALPKQGLAVTLYGWFPYYPDSSMKVELVLPTMFLAYPYSGSSTITDALGSFRLDLYTVNRVDSLAVKVSGGGDHIYVGMPFKSRVPVDSVVVSYPETSTGCAGCETTTGPSSRVSKYEYRYEGRSEPIPF